MKKIISLLLALIMTFSICTVAFAADDTAGEVATTAASEENAPAEGDDFISGDLDFILDLPLWTAKPMLKVAKIALKLLKVVLKICNVFGIEPGDLVAQIEKLIENTQKGEEATTAPTTTVAPVTPAIA